MIIYFKNHCCFCTKKKKKWKYELFFIKEFHENVKTKCQVHKYNTLHLLVIIPTMSWLNNELFIINNLFYIYIQ